MINFGAASSGVLELIKCKALRVRATPVNDLARIPIITQQFAFMTHRLYSNQKRPLSRRICHENQMVRPGYCFNPSARHSSAFSISGISSTYATLA